MLQARVGEVTYGPISSKEKNMKKDKQKKGGMGKKQEERGKIKDTWT
jgi:hypothetical protein